MSSEGLPPETARFVRTHISSVGQLEVLLLLHASPGSAFTSHQINDNLRSNLTSVERVLDMLVNQGLVSVEPGPPQRFRFAPATDELSNAVNGLAQIYQDFRGRVIDLIYSPREQMQRFSDAFRIKEDHDPHG